MSDDIKAALLKALRGKAHPMSHADSVRRECLDCIVAFILSREAAARAEGVAANEEKWRGRLEEMNERLRRGNAALAALAASGGAKCGRCGGTGRVSDYTGPTNGRGVVSRPVAVPCPDCAGGAKAGCACDEWRSDGTHLDGCPVGRAEVLAGEG